MDWSITLDAQTVGLLGLIITSTLFVSWLDQRDKINNLKRDILKRNNENVCLEVTLDKHRKRCSKNTNYNKCKNCEDNNCEYNLYIQKENFEFMKKMTEEHVKSAIESIHGK